MGQDVSGQAQTPAQVRAFSKALLRDYQALERMLAEGLFETGIRRIGAEQELFLVNEAWRPASTALEVLEKLDGPFTTELALYNLEANVEPRELEGRCFSDLQARIEELVTHARDVARGFGTEIALTGILPTLSKSDVTLDNITPRARYYALNEAFSKARAGEPYKLRIQGADELYTEHDSVMLESCNTSFQVHLQVEPDEFAHVYNVVQVVTAPVMAAAVNSPLLFGRHLWHETRIALFQQSIDTRAGTVQLRDLSPRVRFGERWVERGVQDLVQEDIARFRVLLTREVTEDPIELLDRGEVPSLQAFCLHNGTVYRWNRPCYGVGGGKPHLRIECRVIPSGPTILDEVANAAFWVGYVLGAAAEYGDVRERIDFMEAKSNFLAAARNGLKAGFRWPDGATRSASELVLDEALPIARSGLREAGVNPNDIDRYLGIIHERVESGTTGSRWMMRSLREMGDQGTRSERLAAITSGTISREKKGKPVHEWDDVDIREAGGWRLNYEKVEQLMTTQLFTVHEEELVDMVAFMMDRKQIRHVLVEDDAHELVGLVSYRSVLRLMSEGFAPETDRAPAVSTIMERNPTSVAPETPTLDAIDLMRQHRVSVLPVVSDGKLVGIVSERDFMPLAYDLLHDRLSRTS
ncbi:MAG: glutamate-cysteine ligase family protein [Gemmatimonadota bacterium]|nr:glutamate-cysteine ligase family protein [Gemmatimonadota bacterium]MDE3006082.1 glutamate-cysteine ligase family protein [Gemmatimonadota bacterium]MDE3013368.1 glutamate-cysteine ligase family protein [Gemmatimonadota bacterium]